MCSLRHGGEKAQRCFDHTECYKVALIFSLVAVFPLIFLVALYL